MPTSQRAPAIVIGAGPAGLTAAYTLLKKGHPAVVLEAHPELVGGISRTATYRGFRFDIGGHRFFSKSAVVNRLWDELLPNDMLDRPRSSRIYYRGQFYAYPLRAMEALRKLGIFESSVCVMSFLKAQMRPVKDPKNFRDWVSNKFGKRLFEIFFETYTEKVWGMPCAEISSDWAAQRIKGLTLGEAIKDALTAKLPHLLPSARRTIQTSLITSFRYPRLGPGMMWDACAEKIRGLGGEVRMGRRVVGCDFNQETSEWTVTHAGASGDVETTTGKDVLSTAPLRELCGWVGKRLAPAVRTAATQLRYRDFLTVMLILPEQHAFSDNWIYVHDPQVRVGRIQNFKSWSPEMVPDARLCCYGLEYFCFENDGLWQMSDQELLQLAGKELEAIGLGKAADVRDGCVVRQAKAYPVYDDAYAERVTLIRQALEEQFPTLHTLGRNGMHRYNNQDHAMMTGIIGAENVLAGCRRHDPWQVNNDAEYLEENRLETASIDLSGVSDRMVPMRVGG